MTEAVGTEIWHKEVNAHHLKSQKKVGLFFRDLFFPFLCFPSQFLAVCTCGYDLVGSVSRKQKKNLFYARMGTEFSKDANFPKSEEIENEERKKTACF